MLSGAPSHGSWGTLTLANPQMIFFMVSIPRRQLLVLDCPVLCPRALFFEQRMNGAVLGAAHEWRLCHVQGLSICLPV